MFFVILAFDFWRALHNPGFGIAVFVVSCILFVSVYLIVYNWFNNDHE